MKIILKLLRLTLIGSRKNYSVDFHDGLNFISGHTSTGKTSIFEMIDYALGSKSHKSYIEIGSSCSDVELELLIGIEQYRIRRKLSDFTAPIIVEDWNKDKQKYLFHSRLEVVSPSNNNSLSAFLLEKLGLSDFKISGQTFSFRDLFKYSYLKQT
ncbi:MAG: AAA family ATPase, partial [Desulfitobacteriaceae bacterium]